MVTRISTKIIPIYCLYRRGYNCLEVNLFHVESGENLFGEFVHGYVKLSVRPIFQRNDGVITSWGGGVSFPIHLNAPVWDEKYRDLTPDPEKEKELIDIVLKQLGAELSD